MMGGRSAAIGPIAGLDDLRAVLAVVGNAAAIRSELDRLESARAKANADITAAYDHAVQRLEKQIDEADKTTTAAAQLAAEHIEQARVTAGEMIDRARTDQTAAESLRKTLAEDIRMREAALLAVQADQNNRAKELAGTAETLATREVVLARREGELDKRLVAFQAAMKG